MATMFKTFTANDMVNARTLLHEAIPITGTIVSGTYKDLNIKNYAHKYFQSVYDYPYLSSSANHIFDISLGYPATSVCSSSVSTDNDKKIAMYNQMAQVLMGYDPTGSILRFDKDGDLTTTTDKLDGCIFLSFSRLLVKDEIKKGSFTITFITGGQEINVLDTKSKTLGDYGADTEYRVNSPAGEYGILLTSSTAAAGTGVGLIFYQAGVAVITGSIFNKEFGGRSKTYNTQSFQRAIKSGSISDLADGVRNRLANISFNNTIELNSSVYFCRAHHNEFNYSSSPSYTSGSKLRVKSTTLDEPVAYITGIGLYSADNELLATAKLSEPIKKSPQNEVTLKCRIDF